MVFEIAIVGRPNVGKSSIFNKLVGRKVAIVNDISGVTRDRNEYHLDIEGEKVTIVDTAGLEEKAKDEILRLSHEQTVTAIEKADLVLFVVDYKVGLLEHDYYYAKFLRKFNKNIRLLVNKFDVTSQKLLLDSNFYKLGFDDPIFVSAEHKLGFQELNNLIAEEVLIGNENNKESYESLKAIKITIIGRPNVGKSTLVNSLLNENRVVVSDRPGVTRDSIDIEWKYKDHDMLLVDTAGIKKRAKTIEGLDILSSKSSLQSVQYSQIVILVIDATMPFEMQDLTLLDHVVKEGRGLIIALNKWDLVEEQNRKEFLSDVYKMLDTHIHGVKSLPLVPISALYKDNILDLMDDIIRLYELWNTKLTTSVMNQWLKDAYNYYQPPLHQGRAIKFKYMTQLKTRPPTFVIYTNFHKDIPDAYERYLQNSLQERFLLIGIVIRIYFRTMNNPFAKHRKKINPNSTKPYKKRVTKISKK